MEMRPLCVLWRLNGEYRLLPFNTTPNRKGVALWQGELYDIISVQDDCPENALTLKVDALQKRRLAVSVADVSPYDAPQWGTPNALWLFIFDEDRGVWHNTLFAPEPELKDILLRATLHHRPVKSYAAYAEVR